MSGLVFEGGPLSIWKAEQMREEWAGSLQELNAARRAYIDVQDAVARALTQRLARRAEYDGTRTQYWSARNRLVDKIARIDAALAADSVNSNTTSFSLRITNALAALLDKDKTIGDDYNKYIEARDKADQAWQLFQTEDDNVKALRETATDAARTLKSSRDRARPIALFSPKNEDSASKDQRLVNDQQVQTPQKPNAAVEQPRQSPPNEQKTEPQSGVGLSLEQKLQIENAIYEFHAIHSSLWGLVYYFALAPSDLLVLVLVIAMGVLGSSLQLSYIYVTEFARKPISFYLFRPFLGVITAFVIFIVAKAGVPVITDTTRFGGNAPINPYFISFLGIISGLLSERALETVRRLGANYFREGGTAEPDRWARAHVKTDLAPMTANIKIAQANMKVPDKEFSAWVDGTEPVPPDAQKVIAALLGKPRRDLFTDLAPDTA